jgi:two-component system OmpR family sensor kinase
MRTPLRVKLVAVVVLLSGLGLLISGLAATTALRGYLESRVDDQLVGFLGGRIPADGRGPGGDRFSTVFRQFTDNDGSVIRVVPGRLAGPDLPDRVPTRPTTVPSVQGGEAPWRVIGAVDQQGRPVVLGLNLGDIESTTSRLILLETGVGLVVLLAIGAVAYLVVQRSLRPLVEVEQTAEAIAGGDLSQRVPESDPRTEVGSLSRSFNAMLTQIETAFAEREASEAEARASEDRMRRFVGDASHELRTPLTSIRGFAELHRQGALTTPAEVERAMLRVESEAARMGLLVEDLLLLARLDQQRPLESAPVDLLELARDAVQDALAADSTHEVTLEADGAPVVLGDAQRLRQVFGNLVSNALTHGGTAVAVRLSSSADRAVLEVIDHGPGIPPQDRARVFERFYRTDASRTRASGGNGLGLSIVSALVAAHGGTVLVEETPGGGATFRVSLPLSP